MMKPEQFVTICRQIYGEQWRPIVMRELGISYPTLWRYATGRYPIPRKIELSVERLRDKKKGRKC